MWRSLLTDLESVLKGAKPADLIRVPKSNPASRGEDAAAFSEWLPYRAWIADRQVFVNLDALGFCLEVRPQSGADEEMARVLTALYAASPPGTGIQFHLYASPAIRAPLARYANLRLPDEVVPELDTLGRAGRHTNCFFVQHARHTDLQIGLQPPDEAPLRLSCLRGRKARRNRLRSAKCAELGVWNVPSSKLARRTCQPRN